MELDSTQHDTVVLTHVSLKKKKKIASETCTVLFFSGSAQALLTHSPNMSITMAILSPSQHNLYEMCISDSFIFFPAETSC